MPSTFAGELVDLIMSFLHPTPLICGNGEENFLDRSTAVTAGSCGLVCRAWVPSSRRILFYRVKISQDTAYRFATLLKRPNRLTFLPFIRELVFAHGIVEHRWMTTVLPKIVQHLPNAIYMLGYDIRFHRTPDNVLPCPKLLGITHLNISDMTAPNLAEVVYCIASFPALQALKLWVYEWSEIELPEDPPAPPDTLCSMDLNFPDIRPFLVWTHRKRIPISTLALFFPEPVTEEGELEYAAQYIDSLGTSLTSLSIGFDDSWGAGVSTKLLL